MLGLLALLLSQSLRSLPGARSIAARRVLAEPHNNTQCRCCAIRRAVRIIISCLMRVNRLRYNHAEM